ncbi:MFS domain-containing protein [Meloidogyne graminicola]|uniref:MFS domain-containing protein n=1 Tax=Meloidogyne graminicola TaxID=189291 RepID=A0A8S9Z930_9BILA|nr:MFS domain-containing protein [Meloidogyne graminicola]
MLFSIFAIYTPKWKCLLLNNNLTNNYERDCTIYLNCPLENLEFEESPFYSATMEFNWYCGYGAYYRTLFSQIQFIGVLLGTLLMAPLSDKFGRKPIGLISLTIGLSMLAFSSLSPNGYILLINRFIIALFMGGSLVVIATYTMEIIPSEHRITLRTFCNWGLCRVVMTTICYYFPEWRTSSIALSLASVPAIFIFAFIIPESPIWLHSQGKIEKMRSSEKYIARIAGIPYKPIEHVEICKAEVRAIFHDKILFERLLVLWLMWFCSSLSSYSVDLNSSNFSGDLFINQWLLSCPVIISKMFLFILDSNWPSFSRRTLHQFSQLIVCISFLLLIFLIVIKYEGIWILLINLFGTIFLEFTWDANVLCTLESIPTQMRATALGSCSMIARIGGIFAPMLVFFNEMWGASAYLTIVIVGTCNLLSSYIWLIDTKGVDLDTVNLGVEKESGEDDDDKLEEENIKFIPSENCLIEKVEF